jgi:cytochrome P450
VHELLLDYSERYTITSPSESAQNELTPSGRKMFLVWLATKPFIVIHDKEAIKKVLLNSSKFPKEQDNNADSRSLFEKGVFANIMKPLVGNGLLTSEGNVWRIHHKLAVSAFQPLRYQDAMPQIGEKIKDLISKWLSKGHKSIDLCSEFSRLTLDNLGVVAFGEVRILKDCVANEIISSIRILMP